jgi:hypothetical protein
MQALISVQKASKSKAEGVKFETHHLTMVEAMELKISASRSH